MLREVGFWADDVRHHADDRPHPVILRNCPASVDSSALLKHEELVAYLTTAAFVESVELGFSHCRFGEGCETSGGHRSAEMGCASVTDGVYVWPEGLVHYVLHHEMADRLPLHFLVHARDAIRQWRLLTSREELPRLNCWTLEEAATAGSSGAGGRQLKPLAASWRDYLKARSPHLRPCEECSSAEDAALFLQCSRDAAHEGIRDVLQGKSGLPPIPMLPWWSTATAAHQLMERGTPFVIDGTAYVQRWPAVTDEWIRVQAVDGSLKADASAMLKAFDGRVPTVPTAWEKMSITSDGSAAGSVQASYGSTKHVPMPLADALEAICNTTLGHGSSGTTTGDNTDTAKDRCYIKDWHIVQDLPPPPTAPTTIAARAYRVPMVFASDMLNWSCDATAATDYRFCYCGSGGTSTPLHHDVLSSCSWSCNVVGWKLWLFIPPEASREHLYDAWGNLSVPSLLSDDELAVVRGASPASVSSAPAVSDARKKLSGLGCISYCLQPPGSAVFVPPGLHHEVHNLGPAHLAVLSINHNWWNELVGLKEAWAFLQRELGAARTSIADCRSSHTTATGTSHSNKQEKAAEDAAEDEGDVVDWEWEAQVQRLVHVNAGFNLQEFVGLLLGRMHALLDEVAAGNAATAETAAGAEGGGGAGAGLAIDWNAPASVSVGLDDPHEAASTFAFLPRPLKLRAIAALLGVVKDCVTAERGYVLGGSAEKRAAWRLTEHGADAAVRPSRGKAIVVRDWEGSDVSAAIDRADAFLSLNDRLS